MQVLVSNVGSTSLKFKLFSMPEDQVLCEARIERVGSNTAIYQYKNTLTGWSVKQEGLKGYDRREPWCRTVCIGSEGSRV